MQPINPSLELALAGPHLGLPIAQLFPLKPKLGRIGALAPVFLDPRTRRVEALPEFTQTRVTAIALASVIAARVCASRNFSLIASLCGVGERP